MERTHHCEVWRRYRLAYVQSALSVAGLNGLSSASSFTVADEFFVSKSFHLLHGRLVTEPSTLTITGTATRVFITGTAIVLVISIIIIRMITRK